MSWFNTIHNIIWYDIIYNMIYLYINTYTHCVRFIALFFQGWDGHVEAREDAAISGLVFRGIYNWFMIAELVYNLAHYGLQMFLVDLQL